jgi:hypothetical protein
MPRPCRPYPFRTFSFKRVMSAMIPTAAVDSLGQARLVSTIRDGAISWASVKASGEHSGFRQRQIRTSHLSKRDPVKHGASCSTRARRPWPTATTPHDGQAACV